jgi:hypothetical protein
MQISDTGNGVGLRPRLPVGAPCHCMPWSSHIVNDPRAFSAAFHVFQFIVRYFVRLLLFASITPPVYGQR